MSVGRLILHRFCGDEEFVITSAQILAVQEEKHVRLWFEVETEGECVAQLADTANLNAHPRAEVGIGLKTLDATKLVGRTFKIASGYEPGEAAYFATIYYVEHEELRENEIQVLGQDGNVFRARWLGLTTDVNYYDGTKPDTRVEIDAYFTFKDMEKWLGP